MTGRGSKVMQVILRLEARITVHHRAGILFQSVHKLIKRCAVHIVAQLAIDGIKIPVELAGLRMLTHAAAQEVLAQTVVDLKGTVDCLHDQAY